MNWQKSPLNLKTFSFSVVLGLSLIPPIPATAQAQPSPLGQSLSSGSIIAQAFTPPKVGAPPTTAGGGARSSCVKSAQPLTALTPANIMPLTLDSNPTFFVYLPKTDAKTAEFVIQDEDENDVYRTTMPVPDKAGILRLKLPARPNTTALKIGQNYRWLFALVCKPKDRREDIFVDGWVQRIQPTATLASVKKVSPQEVPSVYAKAGIWHEALTSLADLRLSRPQDQKIISNWKELLNSVGLEKIADQPLVK